MLPSILLSAFLLVSASYGEINMMQVKETLYRHYYKELPDSLKRLPWNELKTHLDPYTRILNKKELERFEKDMTMTANGVVGISVDTSEEGFYIDETYTEGSAYKRGIMRGDIIKKIDNKIPKNREDITKLIRGRDGTNVVFEIERNNKILKFKLERDVIHYPNVYSTKLGKTAIIRIDAFHDLSAMDFMLHSVSLKPKEIDTLIIDLRYNGGGLLLDCLMICDEFFNKNTLICNRIHRNDTLQDFTRFDGGVWTDDKVIIILQNEYTASASELLSAVLKYGKRAIVVGNTSFGKGVVQGQYEIDNGRMFITNSEYFPMGYVKVHKRGIAPDYAMNTLFLDSEHLDFDLEVFRRQYPLPSIEALNDKRIKGKEHISHLIWELEGELFEILLQKPYIRCSQK